MNKSINQKHLVTTCKVYNDKHFVLTTEHETAMQYDTVPANQSIFNGKCAVKRHFRPMRFGWDGAGGVYSLWCRSNIKQTLNKMINSVAADLVKKLQF